MSYAIDKRTRRLPVIDTPPDAGPRREYAVIPGVEEQLTYRCVVNFPRERDLAVRMFERGPGAVLGREVAFALLRAIEIPRDVLARVDSASAIRKAYRGLRAALAAKVVPVTPMDARERVVADLRFEASRRVFRFEIPGTQRFSLVCHILAPRSETTTARLLEDVVDAYYHGTKEPAWYDEREDLFVRCQVVRQRPWDRLARRTYCDIVIAPPKVTTDLLPVPKPSVEASPNGLQSNVIPGAGVLGADTDAVHRQAERDWHFVAERLRQAEEHERPIDEAFITDLAKRRWRNARSALAAGPGAHVPGPSLDTSERIVRSIVEMHRLARSAESGNDVPPQR
jgi:hypothetical protein